MKFTQISHILYEVVLIFQQYYLSMMARNPVLILSHLDLSDLFRRERVTEPEPTISVYYTYLINLLWMSYLKIAILSLELGQQAANLKEINFHFGLSFIIDRDIYVVELENRIAQCNIIRPNVSNLTLSLIYDMTWIRFWAFKSFMVLH